MNSYVSAITPWRGTVKLGGGLENDRNVYFIFDILEEKSIRFPSLEGYGVAGGWVEQIILLSNPPRLRLKNRRIHPSKEGIHKSHTLPNPPRLRLKNRRIHPSKEGIHIHC